MSNSNGQNCSLEGSLEAHEQRLVEREIEKTGDHQALQAHTSKRVGINSKGNFRGRGSGKNFRSSFKRNTQNQEHGKNEEDQPESSNKKKISVTREKKRKRQLTGKELNVSIANGLDIFQQSV